jgi:hypothetical protein
MCDGYMDLHGTPAVLLRLSQQGVNAKKSGVSADYLFLVISSVSFYNVFRQVFPKVQLLRYVWHLGFSFAKTLQTCLFPWLFTNHHMSFP